jgi:hypothetical protein
LTPRAKKLAFFGEDHDLVPRKRSYRHIDVVLGVHGYPGDVAKIQFLGDGRPPANNLKHPHSPLYEPPDRLGNPSPRPHTTSFSYVL